MRGKICFAILFGLLIRLDSAVAQKQMLNVTLRSQQQLHEGGRYHTQFREQQWVPHETCIIVCDMWDSHHCHNAVKRVGELTTRMNQVINTARDKGVLIIHSPSNCMSAYSDHPARKRALAIPQAGNLPKDIGSWCHWMPNDEQQHYPIDQSDGGDDNTPDEHNAWANRLSAKGLNPGSPWKKQVDGLHIDGEKDYIAEEGVTVWSIQEKHGIKNVIILGVHTNMCVLGRPFGLRRMAQGGRNVVLMRDMTDTMYNPRMHPYCSHFTGTDLIIKHIETFVAPTITSDQVLDDGKEFRFKNDHRKHIVIVAAEKEYKTDQSLSQFAEDYLSHDFRVSHVYADDKNRDRLHGWEAIADADVLLISVRRRALPTEQLAAIRRHIQSGKPVVGIRTASHAFALRNGEAPEGHQQWPEFDSQVWGGNYTGHHGNTETAYVQTIKGTEHPIHAGVSADEFKSGGSLYKTSPLGKHATPLMTGRIAGVAKNEPTAWVNETKFGGKAFYTSLGHTSDFAEPSFKRLLANGIYWATGIPIPEKLQTGKERAIEWCKNFDPTKAEKLSAPDPDDFTLHPSTSNNDLRVPADLELDLVLKNPRIANPLYINFDERGRMWLVEYRQYPWPAGLKLISRDKVWRNVYEPQFAPPPPHAKDSPFRGADRITIHEDTNGDGTYDKHKTFLDGLNMCTAALKGRGGVYVMNPPYLLYYADTDGDDVPDDPNPRILLYGFGHEDSHSLANSLRWGPDGWIYGTQGSTVSAQVVRCGDDGKPLPDEQPVHSMGQNVWRYHPEQHIYEVFAEGGGNAFGVEFDAAGRVYSGHNGGNTRGFHYVQGGYYQKTFGKHGSLSNPFAFTHFPAMKHPNVERFTHTFEIYESTELPQRYHGKLFGVSPNIHYIVTSDIFADGSSRQTKDIARVVDANPAINKSNWFCPVDIQTGPDGAIYIADWYSVNVNHYASHEQDATNPDLGRVYRLRGLTQPFAKPFDLAKSSSENLVKVCLVHPNRWYRETALRLLGDRRDDSVVPMLKSMLADQENSHALEALWAINLCGGLDRQTFEMALIHSNADVCRWAIRLLGDRGNASTLINRLETIAGNSKNAEVRCQLAATARRLPTDQALAILSAMLESGANEEIDSNDVHILAMIWWALEKHADHRLVVLDALRRNEWWDSKITVDGMSLAQCMMKRWAMSGSPEDLKACGTLLELSRSADDGARQSLVQAFTSAFEGREMPVLPNNLAQQLASAQGNFAVLLGIRSGNADAIKKALRMVSDDSIAEDDRVQCICALGDVSATPEQTIPVLLELLRNQSKRLQRTALSALQKFSHPQIAAKILAEYANLGVEVQESAQAALASRANWARQLMNAVDGGAIAVDSLHDDTVARLKLHQKDAQLVELINKHFPEQKTDDAQLNERIDLLSEIIRSQPGNAKNGERIFSETANCAKCHTLFKKGGDIGPDLTAYNRTNIRDMLMAVVQPDAEIREGFETLAVMTIDGQVLTGFKISETPATLVLRGSDGQNIVINKDDIEDQRQSRRSLMPDDLIAGLSDQELRDLFAYLSSTTPPY